MRYSIATSIAAFALLAACGSSSTTVADRDPDAGKKPDTGAERDGATKKDTSAPAPTCTLGTVSFTMLPPATGSTTYSYESSFSIPGDGAWWYSLATADGTPVQIILDATVCATCAFAEDAIGQSCSSVPAGGVSVSWDGTAVAGHSTCNGQSCDVTTCMPAGSYVATMCASGPGQGCNSGSASSGQTCLHVPFDYPKTKNVVGTLPAVCPDCPDASPPPPPPDAGSVFACGTLGIMCHSGDEYCLITDDPGPDGGPNPIAECEPTPSSCPLPTTCACAESGLSDANVQNCSANAGQVTITATST